MMYTKQEINDIINMKGVDGNQIDIFKLHGVVFLGNSQINEYGRSEWNLDKTYDKYTEHSLFIDYEAFEYCTNEEMVHDMFYDELKEAFRSRII